MASNYGNLGILYEIRCELDKAKEYYLKSLAITEELGIKETSANQYVNLGLLYETLGELDKTRESWQKSVALYQQVSMPHMVKKVESWIDELDEVLKYQ